MSLLKISQNILNQANEGLKDINNKNNSKGSVIGNPIAHDSAHMHVQGSATYIDDMQYQRALSMLHLR